MAVTEGDKQWFELYMWAAKNGASREIQGAAMKWSARGVAHLVRDLGGDPYAILGIDPETGLKHRPVKATVSD